MPYHSNLVSSDLIWEIARNNNSFLVKRNTEGGIRFSRDPYNLLNVHSRKNAGFVNEKAVAISPAEGDKGGVTLSTKKANNTHKPAASQHSVTFSGNKSSRKSYKGIASTVAGNGYRPDLRAHAVARASAIRKSQQPVRDSPEKKLRGAKAKAAAEKET